MKTNKPLPQKLVINGERYVLWESKTEPKTIELRHKAEPKRTLGRNVFIKLKSVGIPIRKFMGLADGISYMTLVKINAGQPVRRDSYEKYRKGVMRAGL